MKSRSSLVIGAVILLLSWGCSEPKESSPGKSNLSDAGGSGVMDSGSGSPGIDGGNVCETWVVEYELSGSKFDIRNTPFGAGDASNDIGPGTLKLRFMDDNGSLGAGAVSLISYNMTMNFDVNMVLSELTGEAGPDECGVTSGDYSAGAITWSGPMRGYHVEGTIT